MADAQAMSGGVMVLVGRGRARWGAMTVQQRTMMGVCALLLVAACAGVAWWEGRTDWRVLYAGLESRDVQQVEQELAAAGIGYETTTDGGGVQVPAELLDKARMEVAAKGMPQSGRMGFELFDKPNWVGSEFDEKVNYQRALEGELEHTIATLGAVRSARVHLVLPKESLFAQEREAAKASVVLRLKKATMAAEQVESIRNLVAGAVENLSPDHVVLVDADGRANLSAAGRGADGADAEREMEQKLVAVLEPLAGRENVRTTVNIAYEDGTRERTDEVVDPGQVVALQVEKRDEISGQAARASGVPGTASNTPAAVAPGSVAAAAKEALPVLPVFPGGMTQPSSSHEESGTYAVSRHTTHEEFGAGRVRRVSAAVLVNDREIHEGEGRTAKVSWKPRTAEEMKRLETLAQAAIGFDAKRGDQVVMQNLSFSDNVPPAKVENMQKAMDQAQSLLRTQPGILRIAAATLLGLLLLTMVVKPVSKQVIAVLKEPLALGDGAVRGAGMAGGGVAGLPEAARGTRLVRAGAIDEEGVREYVAEHIRRDPAQSKRLLEAWIGNKDGAA